MKHKLTHARHDPITCIVPGLFRSLKRGERKGIELDVCHRFGHNAMARFVGLEPLDGFDLRILQGLIALAGPEGENLSIAPRSEVGKALRRLLTLQGDAAQQDAILVRAHLTALLFEIGMSDGGENLKAARASLLRMSNITTIVCSGSDESSFRLLSYAFDSETGQLVCALNPNVSAAITGKRYIRIDMHETRALQTEPARLIHQRICSWLNPGKTGKITVDTLCSYVWPDEVSNPNTLKSRRQTARRALAELIELEWNVTEYAASKYEIGRPKLRNSVIRNP